MRKRTTSQVICENFKIPPQTIFQDYKCNYKGSVLFFGRIYVGDNHFLFIANMFGLVKKCCLKIDDVTKIDGSQDGSTIIVKVKNQGNQVQYIFGGFKNHNAYKLMKALWKGQQIGSDVLKSQNEQDNQQFSMLQQGDSKLLIQQGQVQANFFNPQAVDSTKQKLVQIILPCSIQQFYTFFLADDATVYPRRKHIESRSGKDIKVTEWRRNQQLNSQIRQITATLKVTGVPFVSEAGMSQVWMLKRNQDTLQLNVVTQMADVPYAAYFNCQEHITVSKQGQKKCRMICEDAIVFNKSTYMKGTIIARTYNDLKEEYEGWIKNVNNILDQIRKKKDQNQSDSKISDIEYESESKPEQRQKPVPVGVRQKKGNPLTKIRNLTLQEKVDITFKIVIVLLLLNIFQIFHRAIDL